MTQANTLTRNEVQVMREVIVKVTQILSGKGIRVTQQGIKAYVMADPKSGKPLRVNLPELPDNATRELLAALQGFLDHEVAHILFSDFTEMGKLNRKLARDKADANVTGLTKSLANIVEDCWIEDAMTKRFNGSGDNLDATRRFVINNWSGPEINRAIAEGEDSGKIASMLFPWALRALRGQKACVDYMSDKWHHFGKMESTLKAFGPQLRRVTNTAAANELATAIVKAFTETPPPAPPKSNKEKSSEKNDGKADKDTKQEDKGESDEKQDSKDDAGEKSDDAEEGKGDEGDEGEEGEKPESKKSDDEGDDDKESDEGSSGGDDKKSDESGDEEESEEGGAGGDDEKEEKPENKTDAGGGDNAEAEDEEQEEEPGNGKAPDEDGEGEDGDQGGEGEANGETQEAEGESNGTDPKNNDDQSGAEGGSMPEAGEAEKLELTAEDIKSLDDAASEALSGMIAALVAGADSPYLPYSREVDYLGPLWHTAMLDAPLTKFPIIERAEHYAHGLMSEMQKVFIARSAAHWQPGLRRGKLNRTALHRLSTGDDRIFRRKMETQTRSVAVELLIDCSGSMNGAGKIDSAATAAYIFADVLDRCQVANEVLAFSTMCIENATRLGVQSRFNELMREAHAEAEKIHSASYGSVPFTRYAPTCTYILKGFNNRFGQRERATLGALPSYREAMVNNVDGEAVQTAAQRLMNRKETRKVLIVFSDGQPACDGGRAGVHQHLKDTVRGVEKAGIEVFGLGIMNHNVGNYYSKFEVVEEPQEIPAKILGILRQMVLKIS